MAQFKCKKCNAKNKVKEEWIAQAVNRLVSCNSCGHQMNLNLAPKNNPAGTQVVAIKKASTKEGFILKLAELNNGISQFNIPIKTSTYKIYLGRNPKSKATDIDNDKDLVWLIDDPYISRLHCIIRVLKRKTGYTLSIEDCLSQNGTLVNNVKLESEDAILLNEGDEVMLGDVSFKINKN